MSIKFDKEKAYNHLIGNFLESVFKTWLFLTNGFGNV